MRLLRLVAVWLAVAGVCACHRTPPASEDPRPDRTSNTPAPNAATDLAYVCPMDREVRSNNPGKCPRCGMALVAGIPDPTEYHMDLTISPKPVKPNEPVHLAFEVFDPWKDRRVEKFTVVHEKLFHMFIVSRDLQYFVHAHPTWHEGRFSYDITLPKPGMYRVLGDFYPEAAAPQLLSETIFVAGAEAAAPAIGRDYSTKAAENLSVDIATSPPDPVAGVTAQLRLTLTPGDGLEKYLGAWGHMLAASDDLIDMIHTHPFIADGSPQMQFSLVFPRPRPYRLWVQFQRRGVVNTAHFDVAVHAPEAAAH